MSFSASLVTFVLFAISSVFPPPFYQTQNAKFRGPNLKR